MMMMMMISLDTSDCSFQLTEQLAYSEQSQFLMMSGISKEPMEFTNNFPLKGTWIYKRQGLMPPDNTGQAKLQAIAAVPILTGKGISHEYLKWQTETVSERGYLLESQYLPPPTLTEVILLIPFSAENFALEQSNAVVTFPTSPLAPTLEGPISLV
ncbi:hypothetical protein BTVI_07127 [Pitangus sulphuratus]|nr:hypothetical protein BTVI_07127 [Pitangus sulphuratus]